MNVKDEFCAEINFGGVAGVSPAEGVADKPTKRRESSCSQERFVERLCLVARGRLSPPSLVHFKPTLKVTLYSLPL